MEHASRFSRRDWLLATASVLPLSAQTAQQPLNRFPRMVHEYFVRRVREAEAESLRLKNAIRTAADAERYVASVKERVRLAMGPMPERTPLNPRITGTIERDAYRVEKVVFESRPGFLVTANLYIPKGTATPRPGIVGSCGHSANGKCGETYQAFSQGLARQGYVVLIFDPIGQGERFQYTDDQLQPRRGVGTREHLYAGNQQVLNGEFFGGWRAWDGIRALDYLLTRPEVDRRHIGITGNSGGGTMSTWLCGLEDRWTMAAPSCFVTTFRRNLENELPADTEQCPPGAIALGLDHDDFIAAMAPKPVILLGKERDFFDARGFEEAYWRLKRLWGLLGKEENLARFMGPTPHGYSQENREAMYGWFNHVTGVRQGSAEPNLTIEKDETLWCTPRGQVAGVQSKPIYSFTRERSEEFRAGRRPLSAAALRDAVTGVLRLPPRHGPPDFRILRSLQKRGYPETFATPYAVETEPGIHALVYRLSAERHDSRPSRGMRRAVLYVSHRSADADLRDEPLVRVIHKTERGVPFYACDVRGIGESQPDTCGENSFESPYGSDYFYAAHALMLDSPYPGQRTHDLLRVLDWMAGYEHEEIHLVAKGWGAIPAAFAALLSPLVSQVTLKNALTSYSEVAEAEAYGWRLSSLLPGVLHSFDLPDVYRALAPKQLRQMEPWGAQA